MNAVRLTVLLRQISSDLCADAALHTSTVGMHCHLPMYGTWMKSRMWMNFEQIHWLLSRSLATIQHMVCCPMPLLPDTIKIQFHGNRMGGPLTTPDVTFSLMTLQCMGSQSA